MYLHTKVNISTSLFLSLLLHTKQDVTESTGMVSFYDKHHSRLVRNVGMLPLPPPIIPPPPNGTCSVTCGVDGLKILNTETCQCVCARGIPAICPSPTPRIRTKKTKATKRRRERSHKKKKPRYYGCPEYTPGGRLKKPKTKKSKKTKGTKTITPSQTTNLCPAGQIIDTDTCQCEFDV